MLSKHKISPLHQVPKRYFTSNSYVSYITKPKSFGIIIGGVISSYLLYKYTTPSFIVRPEGDSPIEKQFYEFATIEENNNWYMTRKDFFNACGIKNWEVIDQSKENSSYLISLQKRWEKRKITLPLSENDSKHDLNDAIGLFNSLDSSRNGRISLDDFKTFTNLLNAEDRDFQALFKLSDINNDGCLSLSEFNQGLRKHLPQLFDNKSKLFNVDSPLMISFFGENGDKLLNYSEFKSFMENIEELVIKANFDELDKDSTGEISIEDLSNLFIAQSKSGIIPKHILHNLYELKEKRKNSNGISYEEYRALHNFIKHIKFVEEFIRSHKTGVFTKDEFNNAMISECNISLNSMEINWVFNLFANPETGKLDGYSVTQVCNNLISELPDPPKMKLYQSMLIGGASAMVGATTVFPIDKIKTRLQSSSSNQGIYSVLKDIIKKEGPLRLYRGLQAQLVGITPEKAVKLTVNDYLRKRMIKKHQAESGESKVELSVIEEMLAGMGTGMVQVFISNPIEIVKIRLQMQTSNIQSPFSVIQQLGIRGLYTGLSATLLRDIPFNVMYFSTYQGMKKIFLSHEQSKLEKGDNTQVSLTATQLLLSSCIAGSIAAGIDTPADGIKTKLQNGQGKYDGILHCAKDIYKADGIKGFFRGCTARILIMSPLFGITMMCYELLQRFFFPNTKTGIETIDEDFVSMRRARLHNIHNDLQLRYPSTDNKE